MIAEFLENYYKTHPNMHEWNARINDHKILLDLIFQYSIKSVLEIGTFEGYTANLIDAFLSTLSREHKVTTTDLFVDKPETLCSSVDYIFRSKLQPSHYDMVFIDGNHAYDGPASDYPFSLKCSPKVILFHDADSAGVMEFLRESEEYGHKIVYVKGDCLLAYEIIN